MYDIEPLDQSEPRYSESAQEKRNSNVNYTLWRAFEENIGFPNIEEMIGFSDSIVPQLDLESGEEGIKDSMNFYWESEYGQIKKLQTYVAEWADSINTSNTNGKYHAFSNEDKYISL